jgi:LEA14-like dessication related protein
MKKTTLLFKNILSALILLISLLFINKANATVTITKPTLPITTCSFPSSYSTLGNIVITEGAAADFSTAAGATIILTAPANFQFDTTVNPTVTFTAARNITVAAGVVNSATQITITYTTTGTGLLDVMTIAGIQIRATAASAAVNITRTGGTGTITGLVNATTVTTSLTSTLNTVPAQPTTITGSASPCSGSSQIYSVTNVAGTTYNWTFPTGWSQTAGGTTNSVTVTTNGTAGTITVTPSNTCGSGTARTLAVTPIISPTITTTTPNSRDLAGTVTLGATASVGTISWYAALTGGSALGTGTSYTTPSISTTTTYYVEVNNGGCISTPRIAVVAAVNYPEINVQGNTYSISKGDTSPQYIDFTDFGESVVGTSISKTFLIQNTGAGALTINSIAFSGSNPGDFTVTTPPSTTIAAGTSSTFVVRFNTLTAALRSATLTINNNDSDEAVYDFKIQSTAAALNAGPEIAIQGNSTYIPDGNTAYNTPDFTEFGENYTNTPTTRIYTIYNSGSTTLNITGLTTSNIADFSISTPPSATVAPGSSTTFAVTFNTSSAGIKTTTITVANNDTTGSENPYTFKIEGTGVVSGAAQEIDILGNGNSIPDNSTFTSTSDFTNLGDSFVGTPLVRTYTIKNTGTATLTIGAVTKAGTNSSEFVVSAISASITGGSQTTFTITFTPTGTGSRTATISIVTNDASENPYNFSIEGNGIATAAGVSEIDVQGDSNSIVNGDSTPSIDDYTDFGSNQILTNTTKTFTIRNYGGSNLTLTGTPRVTITGSSDFTVTSQPATPVASLGTTTFTIQFNPTNIIAPTSRTAVVSIANNDSDESLYTFTIQGTAIQTYFDSDGDGVFDNVDVDDDNDGILDTREETNCNNSNGHKVNYKFLNETFGSGGRTTINTTYAATTSYSFQDASTQTNVEGSGMSLDLNDGKYTVGSSAQVASWADQFWYKGADHTGDTNGRMAIFNASYTPGIFYTALITGALPNIPITYSFWVLNLDRTDAPNIATRLRPNIRVEFRDINDNVLQTINTLAIAPTQAGNLSGNWIQFTAPLTFSVNTFKVIFINNETGGIGNDLALDDILITQQLCDLDNDGIADVFDLDADNDGIEDVIEAGLGNISNGKGKIDVAWIDVNGNGLLDSAEPTAAIQALDSDGDGIPNYIDLDSDNDSLFDVDESGAGNTNAVTGYVNGDGDINGDGVGDGPESETFRSKDTNGDTVVEGFGDGILDIYDYGTGGTFTSQYGNLGQGTANANPATTYLKDTDGDGIPDYLDVKSNGSTFDIANNKLIYDYKILDANNDGILDSTTDIDKDGIMDNFDTNTAYFGSPRDLHTKLFLDFDGRNDYGQSTAILGGLSNASLMAWIDLNSAFATDGIIVGQNNFQIRISSAKKLEAIVNGTTVTYNTALNVSQWYNVAAVYGGGFLRLYLNGNLVITQAISGAISADASLLTIGKNPATNTQYFKGKIDEVRVFNVALTDSQLQRMVYQEIKDFGSEIRGEIVPKNVATSPASLPFANLLRYYRMDNYKDDIIDDLTTPAIDVTGTKIYNHKNIYVQQAPMPFLTERTGDFATAVNSPTKEIRGLDIMDQDWSIVKVQHDITETSNNIDLGMLVDSGKTILINNDTKTQNDWYLKLDGKIDLVGKSQLVQSTESDLDVTSAGSIERDQQGQSNLYNYNYWSSPVSPTSIISNNNNYTTNGVMKDGTNPATPANITWVGGYNGSPTTPISLARYWIYTFDNYANAYANWNHIIETTPIRVGQGFTLKGSGASGTQNYVFTGKPNNGTITSNSVGVDQLLLTGNPYPSSLNATAFINDNSGSIDGTLYFWEHYSTNNTHILSDYQGGYAERNLLGGVAPISPTLISGLGSSTKVPGQFIPVGQGFFVNGNLTTGGTVTFKNSQRSFHKEDEIGVSNSLFKTSTKKEKTTAVTNNNDPIVTESYMKIRLGYNTKNSYHRQVLLGFMNEKATTAMDYGYDALNIDDFPNDMYFLVGENQLIIQGVGTFDTNISLPIGVKADAEGKVSFVIDALENIPADQAVFIYDKDSDSYHNIKEQAYEVILPTGTNDSRFSLRFTDKTLKVDQNSIDEIKITHIQNGNILAINNKLLDTTVEKVTLFNILGQSISSWKIENQDQQNIRIPIKNISAGVYIAKIKTSKGESSKKIIVN